MRLKTLEGAEMTTAAKRRNTDPAKLPSALRGDLDWIVMKCIEMDRSRRDDTANGLALDLQRHLAIPRMGQSQLEVIESFLAQAKGFATQASLLGISPAREVELWQRARVILTKCQQHPASPELQRRKLPLDEKTRRVAEAMSNAQLALEKLEVEKRKARGSEVKE